MGFGNVDADRDEVTLSSVNEWRFRTLERMNISIICGFPTEVNDTTLAISS